MIDQGLVSSMKEAFSRYLYDGGPGDAPGHRLPIADALAMGRAAGAKLSLAHPHLHGDRAAGMLKRHRAAGLEGVEAYYAPYDGAERQRWLKVADSLGLVATAGSDRHVADDAALGVDIPEDRGKAIRDWLGA